MRGTWLIDEFLLLDVWLVDSKRLASIQSSPWCAQRPKSTGLTSASLNPSTNHAHHFGNCSAIPLPVCCRRHDEIQSKSTELASDSQNPLSNPSACLTVTHLTQASPLEWTKTDQYTIAVARSMCQAAKFTFVIYRPTNSSCIVMLKFIYCCFIIF